MTCPRHVQHYNVTFTHRTVSGDKALNHSMMGLMVCDVTALTLVKEIHCILGWRQKVRGHRIDQLAASCQGMSRARSHQVHEVQRLFPRHICFVARGDEVARLRKQMPRRVSDVGGVSG